MPSTPCVSITPPKSLQQLVSRRMEYTAEPYQRAVDAIKALHPGMPPIPPAGCGGQALLETQVLEAMRGILSLNSPYPYGICSLTPTPDSLNIVLNREPYVVRAWAERLLPFDLGPECDLCGVSGLRYRIGHHRIYLTVNDGAHHGQIALSGFPVRWWEESVAALLASEDGGTACWLQQDGQWTDRERDFHEASTWKSCDYRIGSGLLRRMALTRFTEGYGGTEVWSDPAGKEGWRWRLELLRGPDDTWLLNQLCDPVFGLPLQTESHHCNCSIDRCGCSATLRSNTTPRQTLYITDLRWPFSPDKRKEQAERQARGNERAFLSKHFTLL